MRHLAEFLILIALIGAAPRAGAAPSWRLAAESPISHRASVATFLDEKDGITAGYGGAVYVTRDGGKTWTAAVNSSACRFGLEARPGTAFTAGNQGHVRLSTDGGEHWTPVASFGRSEPGHARFLSFADARRGLIASPEQAAFTGDGGATWTRLDLPDEAGSIAALSATEEAGALRLRVLDDGGVIFLSSDSGKTWTRTKGPLPHPVFESTTTPWAAMRFNGAEGLLVAFLEEGGLKAHAFRTKDGGKSWSEDALPAPMPAGTPSLSHDGKLLTTCDSRTVRVYRVD